MTENDYYDFDVEDEVCEGYKKRHFNIDDLLIIINIIIFVIVSAIVLSDILYNPFSSQPEKISIASPTGGSSVSIGYVDGLTTVSVSGDGWSEDNDNYYLDVSNITSNESDNIEIKYSYAGIYFGNEIDLRIKVTSWKCKEDNSIIMIVPKNSMDYKIKAAWVKLQYNYLEAGTDNVL